MFGCWNAPIKSGHAVRTRRRACASSLGRAYILRGNAAKARAAYQDFLTLWKDADPDIPILNQAMAEYAKLQ